MTASREELTQVHSDLEPPNTVRVSAENTGDKSQGVGTSRDTEYLAPVQGGGGGREREVRVVGHGARRCMGVALRGHSTYAHTRTTSTYPDAEVFMGRLKVIRTSFDTSDRAAAT
jgi:hypothetical protein